MPKRILLVCTGNSCRSVMAQGLLQHALKQQEHRLSEPVEVASAGIFAIEGMPPSRDTVRLLQQAGIDMSSHMAQVVTDRLIREADLIFVMERFQANELVRRVPDATPKVHLLKTFGLPLASDVASLDADIPDPIGKPPEVYERCFALIRTCVERVANALFAPQEP
ncbi:MAG: low molecular weight protein arginine phosphatase [Candidatus Omnitrophica bacterium]|nr:low molecular weight protein arginine phosphatase [Candidatus Omnitrophota bacterium]